jgi:predicted NAD/FAD-binding protein
MPILNGNLPHKNIAVIGAGISGIGAEHKQRRAWAVMRARLLRVRVAISR